MASTVVASVKILKSVKEPFSYFIDVVFFMGMSTNTTFAWRIKEPFSLTLKARSSGRSGKWRDARDPSMIFPGGAGKPFREVGQLYSSTNIRIRTIGSRILDLKIDHWSSIQARAQMFCQWSTAVVTQTNKNRRVRLCLEDELDSHWKCSQFPILQNS